MFEGRLYKMDSKDPFSGIVYNTYPDGLREYEGEYKDGKQWTGTLYNSPPRRDTHAADSLRMGSVSDSKTIF